MIYLNAFELFFFVSSFVWSFLDALCIVFWKTSPGVTRKGTVVTFCRLEGRVKLKKEFVNILQRMI